ncbi:hypothetical protein AgCh_025722 [Apium graveolens]
MLHCVSLVVTNFDLKPRVERSKLSTKSALCVFLGYGVTQKGYRCFDPVSGKLYVSRHVYFLEHIPFFSVPASSHHITQEELIRIDPFHTNIEDVLTTNSNTSVSEASTSQTPTFPPDSTSTSQTPASPPASTTSKSSPEILDSPPTQSSTECSTPPPVRQSTRIRKSTQLPDFAYSSYSPSASFVTSVHHLSETASYREVVHDPLWQNAMAEKFTALHQTHTWDLVPLPPETHTISCRWVYKIKTKAYGFVERYKARLVAKAVRCEDDISIQVHGFKFASFDDILSNKLGDKFLIDVIVRVVGYSSVESSLNDNKETKKLIMELEDAEFMVQIPVSDDHGSAS